MAGTIETTQYLVEDHLEDSTDSHARVRDALEVFVLTNDGLLVGTVTAVRAGQQVTDLVVKKSMGETVVRAWMAWGGGAKGELKGVCVVAVQDPFQVWPDLGDLLRASVQGKVGIVPMDMQTAEQNNFEQDSSAPRL